MVFILKILRLKTKRIKGGLNNLPIFSLLTFTFPLALRLNFTYSFLAFRFPPSSVFFWFPLSAILFLKYKSVKSGEEVAGGGREIQSVMKNFWRQDVREVSKGMEDFPSSFLQIYYVLSYVRHQPLYVKYSGSAENSEKT